MLDARSKLYIQCTEFVLNLFEMLDQVDEKQTILNVIRPIPLKLLIIFSVSN